MAGNVNLIDPNTSNINNNITNGIPQYQDMYISAELIGISRGRTVLQTDIETDITNIKNTGYEENKRISFLGQNQDPNNSVHFNKFTTNWYDGAVDKDKTFEGFGINNINIVINSSYIPQINIEFIDIRGLAFFNRENSPYRILFNFPPPIFYLTVKGYYGKAITYQMHLVKYNTTFKAETGNYHIDAQFIAITYAPLTDVLFRYIVQAPLMDEKNPITLSSKTNKEPQNTFDLLLKIEQVYSEIPEKLKTDIDNQKYKILQKKLDYYVNLFDMISNYGENKTLNKDTGNPILITHNESVDNDDTGKFKNINTFTEYNEYLKTFTNKDLNNDIPKRIYIGYIINDDNTSEEKIEININSFKENLNKYKKFIIDKSKNNINDINSEDIFEAKVLYNEENATLNNNSDFVRFVGIDITNYYVKLYKGKNRVEENKNNVMGDLNEKINNMIQKRLGMLPTIYNIFKILLKDVDRFFQLLRRISIESEEHHEIFKNYIINDGTYKDTKKKDVEGNTKIYSFPLIIRQEKICNQIKEERRAPIELSRRLDKPFPELRLVQNFIDSFIKYNRIYTQATLKDKKTTEGDYKWIPFTPADSKIVTPSLNSPYFGTDSPGGGSFEQPINLSETNKLDQIFETLLTRFYILSQNAFAYSFYDINLENNVNGSNQLFKTDLNATDEYIKLYAKAEALNLSNSITNEDYASLLEKFSSENNRNNKLNNAENGFYTYLEKNLNELINNNPDYYEISNGVDLYCDRKNDSYVGMEIIYDINSIAFRTGEPDDDFETFVENNKKNIFKKILGMATTLVLLGPDALSDDEAIESSFLFTEENIIYRKDTVSKENEHTPFKTKFLAQESLISKSNNNNSINFYDPKEKYGSVLGYLSNTDSVKYEYEDIINTLSDVGNRAFFDNSIDYSGYEIDYVDIINVWSKNLSFFDIQINDVIIDIDSDKYDSDLAALLFLSNFGNTLSAFNYYPNALNRDYFTKPSIIEIPQFVLLYMGCLVGIEKNDTTWTKIYNFFENGNGVNLTSGGVLIFADIKDINTYLSNNDKQKLKNMYEDWKFEEFPTLAKNVKELYKNVQEDYEKECTILTIPIFITSGRVEKMEIYRGEEAYKCKEKIYKEYFDPENNVDRNGNYNSILRDLIKRVGLICYNEITFNFFDAPFTKYLPLNEVMENNKTQTYFSTFFTELENLIKERKDELEKETEDFKKSTGDEDIMTQTYYSFKNINDKWLAGFNKSMRGYPFKTNPNNDLIDQFVFVDRAMNPIGDTIVDLKSLIDAKDSPDATIFTVISQLLSLNGFEFFPLQNFLNFEENEWTDCFKIYTGSKQTQAPVFVCMYIGGASRYPTTISKFSPFEDDGIVDLENPGVSDFTVTDCEPNPTKDNQLQNNNKNNVYSKVRAFRVRYGEQNQNMFTDFSVDSKEYPETNESIQILSRLAGDEREQAPVPKAQNLYNLYENRAYKATITGFGNAMIQPTQYFQLENVPLYNGAYVILNVEHNISENRMMTKFSGTKILKYPMPRVLNPAAIVGFDGGSSTETNISESTVEEVTLGVGVGNNPFQTFYNSMYEQKIEF